MEPVLSRRQTEIVALLRESGRVGVEDLAAHFEVSLRRARSLMKTLRSELPGYLVPRLVREIAGEPYKTPQA